MKQYFSGSEVRCDANVSNQRPHLDVDHGLLPVRLDVPEVAGVPAPLAVLRGAVFALVQVEVGPGGGAAVGGVAELVDVEAVLALGEVGDLASHVHGVALQGDGTYAVIATVAV